MSKYDIVWAMELGYYFYEIRKVSGSDLTHHIVSIWAHGGLLLDALFNKDKPSGGIHYPIPCADSLLLECHGRLCSGFV